MNSSTFTLVWFAETLGGPCIYGWSSDALARCDAGIAGRRALPGVQAERGFPKYGVESGNWRFNAEGVWKLSNTRRLELRWEIFPISEGPMSWPFTQPEGAREAARRYGEDLTLKVWVIGTYNGQDVIEDALCVFDPKTGAELS